MTGRPEILSPAGDFEKLRMAVEYGADAVYLAGNMFGMRAAAGNFDEKELAEAVDFCHGRGVRVYVACNTLPRNGELPALERFLAQAAEAGADALIIADPGVFALAGRLAPGVARHVSTQAGVTNYGAAAQWYELGASRVVLARELCLDEIREIRAKVPAELELECFVHGSMCVSFSGRCLLSNYLAGRDANRGACAQPCRWKYALMEERRPGEYLPVFEDGEGTHIMNSRDLCMIGHIPELISAGVDSFKIEGRMKSSYYTAVITNAYRRCLDAAQKGREPEEKWLREVETVSHRHYCTGFFFGDDGAMQYYPDSKYIRDCVVCAVVEECDAGGNAVLTQKNRFRAGERLELLTPDGTLMEFTPESMRDAAGESIEVCPHPEMEVRLKLPVCAPKYSILRRRES